MLKTIPPVKRLYNLVDIVLILLIMVRRDHEIEEASFGAFYDGFRRLETDFPNLFRGRSLGFTTTNHCFITELYSALEAAFRFLGQNIDHHPVSLPFPANPDPVLVTNMEEEIAEEFFPLLDGPAESLAEHLRLAAVPTLMT
jgi:hypothetical protein